jgi:hypothetical protein
MEHPRIELVARSGRNKQSMGTIIGLSNQCEPTTYHSNTYVDWQAKFEKDL